MKARGWVSLVVGTLVCVVAAYAAYTLATYSWNQVVDYKSPYAAATLPATAAPADAPTTTASPRVVLVVIDGLRLDTSRAMPTIQKLRAAGFDGVLKTSQPSLSFPDWTSIMSGAPQRISGVTTNWFTGRVPVETIFDTALRAHKDVVVSAPTDFEMLFGVKRFKSVFLRDWTAGQYMTGQIVDHAISLAASSSAPLVVVHFPDVDEAGHASGGASSAYRKMAARVDSDLARVVSALQGPATTFIVTSDHGHIDTGGHGGPEPIVTEVPCVIAGPGVTFGKGTGEQDQVAATVAMLAGIPVPRNSIGAPLLALSGGHVAGDRFDVELTAAYNAYASVVAKPLAGVIVADQPTAPSAAKAFDSATALRLGVERSTRAPIALALLAVCLLAVAAVGLLSWRALVSALAGTAAYYVVYEGLFFVVHRYTWSLSAFNSEELLKGFLNGRMIEAVIAAIVAAAVAADIYLTTRRSPKPPRGEFLSGWLALGTATVLVIMATIGVQVAWYLWYWGASVTWYLPDLSMGFKYDLDLIQLTGLGAAALVAPVVTYLVGRYHPLRRPVAAEVAETD